jgi:di/tricarboxylate transporter
MFFNQPLLACAAVAIYALLFFAGFAGDAEEKAWMFCLLPVVLYYVADKELLHHYEIHNVWEKIVHVLPTAGALLSIMLLGAIAVPIIITRLDDLERALIKVFGERFGTLLTLTIGSLSANILGLAAGEALAKFVKSKMKDSSKYADVALATATALGPGQALIAYAAAAVAIVWPAMNALGIDFTKYALLMYPSLIVGAMLPWLPVLKYLKPSQVIKNKASFLQNFALVLLIVCMGLAIWNVNHIAAIIISCIGIVFGLMMKYHHIQEHNRHHKQDVHTFWSFHSNKEVAIALLFIGIDLTGMFASHAFSALFVGLSTVFTGFIGIAILSALFSAAATSFSDNALATVVGVPSVVAAGTKMGLSPEHIMFLVGLLVLCAVLFGLFFPASNLINLPVKTALFPKREGKPDEIAALEISEWSKASGKYYLIACVPVIIYIINCKIQGIIWWKFSSRGSVEI